MAIYREVETDVYCDVCGEHVIGWKSAGLGVSRAWAAFFCAPRGMYNGQKDYL